MEIRFSPAALSHLSAATELGSPGKHAGGEWGRGAEVLRTYWLTAAVLTAGARLVRKRRRRCWEPCDGCTCGRCGLRSGLQGADEF